MALKEVKKETNIDRSNMLQHSEYMQRIPKKDRMLSPNHLGNKVGISGIKVNKFLRRLGYQEKEGTEWVPNEEKVPSNVVYRRYFEKGQCYHLVWNVNWFLDLWEIHGDPPEEKKTKGKIIKCPLFDGVEDKTK